MSATKVKLTNGREVYLGRISPEAVTDLGDVRMVTSPGGKRRMLPRISRHWDAGRRASPPPDTADWTAKAPKVIARVYGNDREGDCVIASALHQIGVWLANSRGKQVIASDAEALSQYHQICGAGDNGCVITDVLDWTMQHGLKIAATAHKIEGYAACDWTNKLLAKSVINAFGTIKLGINLPGDWTCTDCTWDVTDSEVVGGHDVPVFGYNADGVQIATWGGLVTITWSAFLSRRWIEEAYVPLSPDWFDDSSVAPNGFNVASLRAALADIAAGRVPDIGPPPGPGAGPGPAPTAGPGPGPVPPPPAPPSWPSYAVSLAGTYQDQHGRERPVSLTGSASPDASRHAACKACGGRPGVNYFGLVADLMRLLSDLKAGAEIGVMEADVRALLASLGLQAR